MRRELEILAQIDDFLDGEITKDELLKKVGDFQDLDTQIESQRLLRGAIQKEAFILNSQKALSKFKLFKVVKISSFAILSIGVITAALFLMFGNKHPENKSKSSYSKITNTEKPKAIAESLIPSQFFELNNLRDTVIITEGGMIFSIPQNSYNTLNNEHFKIEIKESITPVDIIKGGLSTMAGATVLETGGMFQISARQDKEALSLSPNQFIEFLVPTANKIPGMKLYNGEVTKDGEINWTNPKTLANTLTSANMNSLNFYPAAYQSCIKRNKSSLKGKSWTDSLYYDLSNITPEDKMIVGKDTTYNHKIQSCINPNLIKAFWNNTFNNTLLATLEFQKRMPLIHKTGSDKILNLYTSNFKKNLYEIDALAMKVASEKHKNAFKYLMQLKEGKVAKSLSGNQLAQLSKAIKTSQQKNKNMNRNKSVSYYRGRITENSNSYWYNIDVPFKERKRRMANEEARYHKLVKNLKIQDEESTSLKTNKFVKARKKIQINVTNSAEFEQTKCFAYILRKDAYTFEKLSIREGLLTIEHKNLDNYELAILGIKEDQKWLCIPGKIENGSIELNLETTKSFESKITAIASSDRFTENLLKKAIKKAALNNGISNGEPSSRLKLSKAIYKVSFDTILNSNDLNIYKKNRFKIQTANYDEAKRKAPYVPTKISSEINYIKAFLNTTEYTVTEQTKPLFNVKIFNAAGDNILTTNCSSNSRKTDKDTRQQNIAFSWNLQDGFTLPKGTYRATIEYRNTNIATQQFEVY